MRGGSEGKERMRSATRGARARKGRRRVERGLRDQRSAEQRYASEMRCCRRGVARFPASLPYPPRALTLQRPLSLALLFASSIEA